MGEAGGKQEARRSSKIELPGWIRKVPPGESRKWQQQGSAARDRSQGQPGLGGGINQRAATGGQQQGATARQKPGAQPDAAGKGAAAGKGPHQEGTAARQQQGT